MSDPFAAASAPSASSAPSAPSKVSVSPHTSGFAPLPTIQNEGGAREFLMAWKWPVPLQETFIANLAKVPLRYFICDDSGSMCGSDGKKLVTTTGTQCRFVTCTRYEELAESLKFHAGFAKAASVPTEFRFLNALSPLRIGFDPFQDNGAYDLLMNQLQSYPSGGTPLCRHIKEITADIQSNAERLRAAGQKAVVIIATDGESSDGDIAAALRPLKDLPAWVVIRLCTNEDRIVNYWNSIDEQLELNMDVLDDHRGEAEEIYNVNFHIVYGEPLQRMREFGVSIKEFDLLDERKLSLTDFHRVCKLFYGSSIDALPIPEVDLAGFLTGLQAEMKKHPMTWDPITLKAKPLVDVRNAARMYKTGGGCTIL